MVRGRRAPSADEHAQHAPKCSHTHTHACVLTHGHTRVLQGAYRDDDGKPVVLESVREAERRIAGVHFME